MMIVSSAPLKTCCIGRQSLSLKPLSSPMAAASAVVQDLPEVFAANRFGEVAIHPGGAPKILFGFIDKRRRRVRRPRPPLRSVDRN